VPRLLTALLAFCLLDACATRPARAPFVTPPRLDLLRAQVLTWPAPTDIEVLAGAMPLRDGGAVGRPELAVARAILRTNPHIAQAEALLLAVATVRAARERRLPPEFLAATLLQESAYDVTALSPAGAIGIAQFMPETAAEVGIDPYDPFAGIAGAAELLSRYLEEYRGVYADPFAAALAAYNAGPFAVQFYRGVPPYPETREYVALIFDHWARIVSYERVKPAGARNGAAR
jgi:soluble lytic murein transglycosylase-like protein